MLNESLSQLYPTRCNEYGEAQFTIDKLTSKGLFEDISFAVHKKKSLAYLASWAQALMSYQKLYSGL